MAARVRSVRNLKGMEIPHRARGRPAPTMKMLVTDAEAAQRTDELVELMPLEWRGDSIKSSDLGELRRRDDCQELLKEIMRAVPLRLLLDHGPRSLVASDKEQLTAPYFFLSTPVEKIGSFVSHRWAANPRQTALALMAHAKLGFLLKVVIPVVYGLYFLLLLTFPPLVVFTVPLVLNFVPYAVLTTRSPLVLRMLPNAGYDKPFFWFDKSTVHQKQNCLTQAGLSLFDYYLKRTGHLTILFTEECAPPPFASSGASLHSHVRVPSADLTRVWCVYELAWWVSHNPKGKIVFVPLRANASLYGLLLNTMPLVITFLLFCMGVVTAMALFFSNAFQDNRQLQKCAARNRSPHTRCCHPVHAPGHSNMMIAFFVVPFLGCVIAVVYLFLTTVLVPAREERVKAAEQLRSFDVRETQAFDPADKQWVQGQICEWWSGKGRAGQGEDAALDAFNHVRLPPNTCAAQA